jgi:hypothetical protein
VVDDLLDLLVADEGAVDAGDAAAAGHVEHVALAQQLLGALSPRMVRLSILEVTWKLMRVGKLALIVPVMTSTEGRCVAMIRWMPEARAICARRWMQASISLPGDHHQVGHLVDDDDDEGHRLGREFLGLEDRLAGLVVEAGLHVR